MCSTTGPPISHHSWHSSGNIKRTLLAMPNSQIGIDTKLLCFWYALIFRGSTLDCRIESWDCSHRSSKNCADSSRPGAFRQSGPCGWPQGWQNPGAPNSPKEGIFIYFRPRSRYFLHAWSPRVCSWAARGPLELGRLL